jgi:hypothetical protein
MEESMIFPVTPERMAGLQRLNAREQTLITLDHPK